MKSIRPVRVLAATLLLAAALAPARAAAQGANLEVIPKIGVFTPLGSLTDQLELTPGLAFGVAAELTLPRTWFTVRLNLDQAHAIEVQELGSDERLGELSITNLSLDLVIRPLGWSALARPYFLAGPALTSYDLADDAVFATSSRTNRFALHVGGGFDIRLGPVSLVLEIADYISTFPGDPDGGGDARVQNHLYGLAGFRIGLF